MALDVTQTNVIPKMEVSTLRLSKARVQTVWRDSRTYYHATFAGGNCGSNFTLFCSAFKNLFD